MTPKQPYYVYQLIDPRTGQAFYVGKGKGNRMHQHERNVRRNKIDNAKKSEIIRDIIACGMSVKCEVVADGMSESQAFAMERAMIQMLPDLTNISSGTVSAYENYKSKVRILLSRVLPFDLWVAQNHYDEVRRYIEKNGGYRSVYDDMVSRLNRLLDVSESDFVYSRGK